MSFSDPAFDICNCSSWHNVSFSFCYFVINMAVTLHSGLIFCFSCAAVFTDFSKSGLAFWYLQSASRCAANRFCTAVYSYVSTANHVIRFKSPIVYHVMLFMWDSWREWSPSRSWRLTETDLCLVLLLLIGPFLSRDHWVSTAKQSEHPWFWVYRDLCRTGRRGARVLTVRWLWQLRGT